MTKLVVSSDWHLDWHTDGYERYGDVGVAVDRVVDRAIELKQEGHDVHFVMLGDATNPYSRGVHRAVAYVILVAIRLHKAGIPSVWLIGNHDVIEDSRGGHVLLALQAAMESFGCLVLSRPGRYSFEGVDYLALPFTSSAFPYSPGDVVERAAAHHCHVCIGHLNIRGITPGSETEKMPRGRDIQFPAEALRRHFPGILKINGHYHEQQMFEDILIPGSLVRLTHGEEHNEPGYLVVTV